MEFVRTVVVLDAADLETESAFWATLLDGHVIADDAFHSVIDAQHQWRIGIQLAPNHQPPQWPNGQPQQVHLDLHVENPHEAHAAAMAAGARLLKEADLTGPEGNQVYSDPAGHPFCIGWGHPSPKELEAFLRDHLSQHTHE